MECHPIIILNPFVEIKYSYIIYKQPPSVPQKCHESVADVNRRASNVVSPSSAGSNWAACLSSPSAFKLNILLNVLYMTMPTLYFPLNHHVKSCK